MSSNPESDVLDAIAALEAEDDEIKRLVDWQIEQGRKRGECGQQWPTLRDIAEREGWYGPAVPDDAGEYGLVDRATLERADEWAAAQSGMPYRFFRLSQVTSMVYHEGVAALFSGAMDWVADDIRAMLCTSEFRVDAYDRLSSDVAQFELEGRGYERGGKPLTGKHVRPDGDTIVFDADDTTWPGAEFRPFGVVVYHHTGDPDTSRLIVGISIDIPELAVSRGFRLTWPSAGVMRLAMRGSGPSR